MPAPPSWQFILTDLQGVTLGEITGAKDRTVTLPHLRVPTASFQVPLWHPRAIDILSGDTLLKCYRKDQLGVNKLVFHGPILSVEENGDTAAQSIAVTATGPLWRLTKRFLGVSKVGFGDGTATALKDLGLIAHDILDTINGVSGGYTGISKGTLAASTNGAVGPWYLKNAAEAIAELSAGINSFDYEVAPTEATNVAQPWPQIGLLNIAPLIGAQKPDAVFEYGTTRANVAAYQRQISRDAMINDAIISVSGWPDGAGAADLLHSVDATSKANRGLFEDVVNDAGVIDDTLRQKIADEHIKYRKNPREIVTFTPATNARPAPFSDYIVGDWVRARAVVRGIVRFDAMFRIWGMSFKLDQNGNENLDLQLVQE